MDAKDLDRYRQFLLAKRRDIGAGAIGTLGAAGVATERLADVIDQAADAAQADLQVHLHQTDSHLLRAIEEALARIDRQAFGICEACQRPHLCCPVGGGALDAPLPRLQGTAGLGSVLKSLERIRVQAIGAC